MQYSSELDHLFSKSPDGKIVRKAVDSPYLHRIQARHFLLFNVLPFVGTMMALALVFYRPIGGVEIGLLLTMWLATGLGVTVGFHRLFTHRSFKPLRSISTGLAIMGSMGGLGSVISWVAMHRRHHECADGPGDMHSPNMHGTDLKGRLRGFLHAHLTWMIKHEYPNPNYYTPDLLRDRTLVWVSRHYQTWVLLGLAIPAVLGGVLTQSWYGALTGLLWGGAVRMFMVTNAMWALNSFLHTMGSRPYQVKDHSGNSTLLSILAWGEGWHHNHHAFPQSAWFGLAWYRFDPGFWLIKTLEAVGLASDVKVPTRETIASKTVQQPATQGGV